MKRVGVLRGGKGKNYHSSLKRGGDLIVCIVENLKDEYKPIDILVDDEDVWHAGGLPVEPAQLVHRVDVVWNTADPSYGITLEQFSIPVISAPHFSSVITESKDMLEQHMRGAKIKMPRSLLIPTYQEDIDGDKESYILRKAKEVHRKFPAPWLVKAFSVDSGMGIHVAKTFAELMEAVEDGVNHDKSILVEEFITGKPGAAHSITNFRGDEVYVLPPHGFNTEEKEKIMKYVNILHKHLDVPHYLKTDFTLHPRLGMYVTSVDFAPDFRTGSHLEEHLHRIGAKLHHVVEHILEHP